jgi:hypothetical protein
MKHNNPYRINDPTDLLEVGENSSHPELRDAKRYYTFGAYRFATATELERFFESEGLSRRDYWMRPVATRNAMGNEIKIEVIPKHKKVRRSEVIEMAR